MQITPWGLEADPVEGRFPLKCRSVQEDSDQCPGKRFFRTNHEEYADGLLEDEQFGANPLDPSSPKYSGFL